MSQHDISILLGTRHFYFALTPELVTAAIKSPEFVLHLTQIPHRNNN